MTTDGSPRRRAEVMSTKPGRRFTRLTAAGLAVGAAGVVVQAAVDADLHGPVPPGAVVLGLTAALTLWVRWRWTLVVSALVAVLGLMNVTEYPKLRVMLGTDGTGVAIGKWLMLLGLLTALVGSLLGLLEVTRRHADTQARGDLSLGGGTGGQAGAASLDATQTRPPAWPRPLQIAGLLVLAPVCAEYLAAYDNTTGDAVVLIGGLVIFAPLYGAPALLIREVARRAGLGWTGIILLAAAFGLIEAGIVDQSLFSLDYRDIDTWDEGVRGTFIAPFGMSAYNALNFVGGHVIYSICAPIALVEAFRPPHQREPWLTTRMLGVVALCWLGASALVLSDSLLNETSHASPYRIAGSVVTVALLVLAAFRYGRPTTIREDRKAPRVGTVFVVALVVATVYNASSTTWLGFAFSAGVVVLATVLLRRAAQSPSWGLPHIVAVASGALLSRALLAFTYFPLLGDVSSIRKYGHNVALLIVVTVVCLLAFRAADAHRKMQAHEPGRLAAGSRA